MLYAKLKKMNCVLFNAIRSESFARTVETAPIRMMIIRCAAVRESGVSRHHGGPNEGPSETPRTSQWSKGDPHYPERRKSRTSDGSFHVLPFATHRQIFSKLH